MIYVILIRTVWVSLSVSLIQNARSGESKEREKERHTSSILPFRQKKNLPFFHIHIHIHIQYFPHYGEKRKSAVHRASGDINSLPEDANYNKPPHRKEWGAVTLKKKKKRKREKKKKIDIPTLTQKAVLYPCKGNYLFGACLPFADDQKKRLTKFSSEPHVFF